VELIDHSPDAVLPPSFGASLRSARLSRDIALDAVAARTKINVAFLQDLERGDLSKWPENQFYRESYLRAYALAIGLNPREVIDRFRREFPGAGPSRPDLPPAAPRRLTPVTIPMILAVTFAVAYTLARWFAPAAPATPLTAPETRSAPSPIEAGQGSNVETSESEPSVAPPASIELPAQPMPDATATATAGAAAEVDGELMVASTPSGARVLVNGINRGVTPLTVRSLPAGEYSVRVIPPGRPGVTRRASISPQRRRAEVLVEFETTPE
jgi:cytoskeletal protein RodZ